jgi:hypothetical protein
VIKHVLDKEGCCCPQQKDSLPLPKTPPDMPCLCWQGLHHATDTSAFSGKNLLFCINAHASDHHPYQLLLAVQSIEGRDKSKNNNNKEGQERGAEKEMALEETERLMDLLEGIVHWKMIAGMIKGMNDARQTVRGLQ